MWDDVVLILDKKKTTLPVQSSARYTLGVVEKSLSDRSFSIRYMNNKKIDRCERSIQGLSVIVKANDAKEVGTRDIVIDPLFPAGKLIDLSERNTQPKGGNSRNAKMCMSLKMTPKTRPLLSPKGSTSNL